MIRRLEKNLERIKEFVKKREIIYKIIFSLWGIKFILRARKIFKKIKPGKDIGFKVLVLAVRTIPTTNLVYFDAIFAHALKRLGANVKMLYCDGILDSCDADTVFRNQKPACFLCKTYGPYLKKALNLDCLSYRELITSEEIRNIEKLSSSLPISEMLNYEYLGVNVGAYARAAVIRYFLLGKIDLDNQDEIKMLREKLKYAMISAKIADEAYRREKPNQIFMLHGSYSTWGPFFEYCRGKGVDVHVYGNQPIRFGRFIFSRNCREYDLVGKKTWEDFKDKPLVDEAKRTINDYLQNRFRGQPKDNLALFQKNIKVQNDKETILETLNREKYQRRYVMYTNLAWDAVVDELGSPFFKDIFSWIDGTINYFKEKPEYQLIIKPHPAELIWEKCNKSISGYIKEKHKDLGKNIIILNPDTPLRAYDLLRTGTVGITFNGTIALEAATEGKPFLVAGNSHYKEAGVVYKIPNIDEYYGLLGDPSLLEDFAGKHKEIAIKYAYFYFFRLMVRVPFYRDDIWAEIDWEYVSDIDRLFNEDNALIKICQKMINSEDIVEPL